MQTNNSEKATGRKEKAAKRLLEIKAVFFRPDDPFIWASGIKSPVYCDNRLILSEAAVRREIEAMLAELISENFPDAALIMGTSTAGIPHAALAADILELPMGYVRAGAKSHGRKNLIEGKLEKGQKTVVVEDLISTGGSALDVADILRLEGADVLGVASIFTYGMDIAGKRFADAGLKAVSLTDFDEVTKTAARLGYIKSEDVERLLRFRDNPLDQSWAEGRA